MNNLPPLKYNKDEQEIWQILMSNDFRAFCSCDWSMIENDFIEKDFFGIDSAKSDDKSLWTLKYNNLESYKKDWITQSEEFKKLSFKIKPLDTLFKITKLNKIEIHQDKALVHKVFDGDFILSNGQVLNFNWISFFNLKKINEQWKIASFVGYLSNK